MIWYVKYCYKVYFVGQNELWMSKSREYYHFSTLCCRAVQYFTINAKVAGNRSSRQQYQLGRQSITIITFTVNLRSTATWSSTDSVYSTGRRNGISPVEMCDVIYMKKTKNNVARTSLYLVIKIAFCEWKCRGYIMMPSTLNVTYYPSRFV